ncbi:DNA-binding SARP family transcriptional activator/tetratricopeptide (TPR) repeat protein [Saccharothrix tamanrassetensis]|uniref:DNA-binding SARP family transcriptional activator/tetratricopeptide (TPR) repeat protein n=1 Tax=Saccharothrix tamanrassetensis TaxID=1051531 RepID=A0A841CY82_9PSEU|nr:BTAD domain-containing putative transcriptional regulator [Saccharothrix tamanrassetensis]MBB5960296.1 DNA-binding SARP family transcriptional activator/tetratricopeptide (TPR) repeat protein [Saccharothrix tamanrassetensis]
MAVRLGAAKRRAVLAALALELNRVVSGDRLLSLVWDGSPPPQAKAALQGHIAQLRKVLAGGVALITRAPGYVLTGERGAVDVFRFEDLVAGAREAADEAAVGMLTSALALWRGPVLADVPGTEVREVVSARLEELRLVAVQELATRLFRLDRAADAVSGLRDAVAAHPLRETLVARLVLALHWTGRQAEALELFHRTRERLVDELGVDPGPELRDAYQTVLAGDTAPKPVERGPVPAQLPREHRGFVGREPELSDLTESLRGDSATGLLVGPAGVGKTALALHWAHRVAAQFPDGQLFVNLRGFDETEPLDPRTALVGFLRALGATDSRIAADLETQAAQYRSVLAGRRVLVFLDNARSAEQVRPLLPGSAGCLVLVTSRHRLDDLVVTEGASALHVQRLPEEGAESLLAAVLGRHRIEQEPDAVAELVELCDRLPLALRIAGARLASRPRWTIQSLVDELRDERHRLSALELPEAGRGVHAALAVSYRELPEGAARLLRRLGLHPGTDLDSYTAAALLDINVASARTHLRTLAYASLLHESTPDRYTRHDLVRLFTHHLAAGESEVDTVLATDRLLDYYLWVADAARAHLSDHVRPFDPPEHRPATFPELPSHAAALDWLTLEEANLRLALDIALNSGRRERTWQLALCLDAFHFRRGNRLDRLALCRIGLVAARELGDEHVEATFLLRLGSTLADLGRLDEAIGACTRAGELAGGDRHLELAALANLGYCLMADDQLDRAQATILEALEVAREVGDARSQAGVQNNLANVLLRKHLPEDALRHASEALGLFTSVAPSKAHTATLHTVGTASQQLGRLEDALESYRAGLALAERLGDRYQEALCRRAIGDVLEQSEGVEAAVPHWLAALHLYRDLRLADADELARKLDPHVLAGPDVSVGATR